MNYSKTTEGQATRFETQAQAVPVPWRLVAIGAVPVVFFLFISLGVAAVVAAIMAALVWARMKVFPAAVKFRASSSFLVSPDQVRIGAQPILRQDIHRAVIRNHVLSASTPSQFVTLHQGVGALTGAASAAANAKFTGQLADISYRVDLEAGGLAHTLAGGLDEPTAFAILSDVSAILKLQPT